MAEAFDILYFDTSSHEVVIAATLVAEKECMQVSGLDEHIIALSFD